MAEKDYYQTLGVDRDASEKDIKRAFRRLAAKYHPDVNHEPGAEQKFKDINEAYEVLGNKEKRARYDQFGAAGVNGQAGAGAGAAGSQFGGFGGFDDIFNMFTGGGARRANPNQPRQGSDLHYTMSLTFMDAVFGKQTKIRYNRQEECKTCHGSGARPGTSPTKCSRCDGSGFIVTMRNTPFGRMQQQSTCPVCGGTGKEIKDKCNTCHGTGRVQQRHEIKVKIPAGVDDGEQMRLAGQGEAGVNGGPYGDLYIVFQVSPSKDFKRDGSEIYVDKNITFAQAALGDRVKVKTVHGDVDLKIPAGTQSGTNFRLRNKGVPHVNGNGNGDEHVRVHVKTPTHLNKRQREALMAYAAASGEKAAEGVKPGFFDKLREAFDDK